MSERTHDIEGDLAKRQLKKETLDEPVSGEASMYYGPVIGIQTGERCRRAPATAEAVVPQTRFVLAAGRVRTVLLSPPAEEATP